jgi:hypothetical protein
MRKHVLQLLALAMLAPLAAAQAVTVSGRIEPLPSPSLCAPQATHRLADTAVNLFSSTLDLTTVSTIPQVFAGTVVPAGCPLVDVSAVTPAGYQLFPCNTTGLGCAITLDQCPSPTSGVFVIAASLSTGFLPVSPSAGSILIDPFHAFTVASGAKTAVCESSPFTLAGPPSLIGVVVNIQAVTVDSGGALLFSNLATVPIGPPGGCTSFACF